MNFEKYRKADTIKLHGIIADVYKKNEEGELIDSICSKDADWLTGKSIFVRSESFNFEQFVLNEINPHFIYDLKPKDITLYGGCLCFWIQEDADGIEDLNGEYLVSYTVAVSINGQYIDEEDLHEIFPNFKYNGENCE